MAIVQWLQQECMCTVSDLNEKRIRMRSGRAHSFIYRENSLLARFTSEHITVSLSLFLYNLLVTYSDLRFAIYFLQRPVFDETALLPGCPRSFGERRHCGVILPGALFVFLHGRMYLSHTRRCTVCESLLNTFRSIVQTIILMYERQIQRKLLSSSVLADCPRRA